MMNKQDDDDEKLHPLLNQNDKDESDYHHLLPYYGSTESETTHRSTTTTTTSSTTKPAAITTTTTLDPLSTTAANSNSNHHHHHHQRKASWFDPAAALFSNLFIKHARSSSGGTSGNYNNHNHGSFRLLSQEEQRQNEENERKQKRTKSAWNKLQNHVRNGSFLVTNHYSTSPTTRQRQSIITPTNAATATTVSSQQPNDENDTINNTNTNRLSRMEQAQSAIRSGMDFTLTQCLIAIFIYILIAVLAFSFIFEQWTIIDSMYFAVVTFSTIGYGDLVPDTWWARIFTCFFALSGVACLGITLGVVGNNLMDAQEKAIKQAEKLSKVRTLTLFSSSGSTMPLLNSNSSGSSSNSKRRSLFAKNDEAAVIPNDNGDNDDDNEETRPVSVLSRSEDEDNDEELAAAVDNGESTMETNATTTIESNDDSNSDTTTTTTTTTVASAFSRIGMEFLGVVLLLSLFAACVAEDPGIETGWDFGTALYYVIITATTVGYGDFSPKSQLGRFIATLFIPIAVGAMGHWLSIVAGLIMENRQTKFRDQLKTNDLTMDDLEIMDADGDGMVTYSEFLEFMLVAMNKVDNETLNELRRIFQRLDEDNSGTLCKDDLIAAAKRKLKSPQRKLAMAAYKQQLLEQARNGR